MGGLCCDAWLSCSVNGPGDCHRIHLWLKRHPFPSGGAFQQCGARRHRRRVCSPAVCGTDDGGKIRLAGADADNGGWAWRKPRRGLWSWCRKLSASSPRGRIRAAFRRSRRAGDDVGDFLPCFLFVVLGAPHVEGLHERPGLSTALTGITAAVVGVILNLAI